MTAEPNLPRRRLRRLTDEEIALWTAVARTVAARPEAMLPRPSTPPPGPAPGSAKDLARPQAPASSSPSRPQEASRPREIPPLEPLERRLRRKLSRGQLAPDATIDLHGLRQHEASSALRRFLLRAQKDGATLVLVVTGKGSAAQGVSGVGFDEEPGVLRRAVPRWLRAHEYHAVVVGFEEAQRPHGGAGALYVRLRRLRRGAPHMRDL